MICALFTISVMTVFATEAAPKEIYTSNVNWERVEKSYIFALNADNIGVRQSAAGYLAEYKLSGGIEPLITILRNDKVESVRMSAALALITIGTVEARKAVEESSLYDGSEKVAKFCESLLTASTEKITIK